MKTGLNFLMAAKRSEMADLHQLARTSALVNTTASFIHQLQRERGLSNLYLASDGRDAVSARHDQLALSQAAELALRSGLEALDTDTHRAAHAHGARLFSRIAYVMHGLDALPALRDAVRQRQWDAERSTAAYSRLIAGLLAVVFEAADSASDPDISRLLVSLFNFMQGKEFMGQERATGAALFAAGRLDARLQQRLLHLIESQARCLEVFHDFASPLVRAKWAECDPVPALATLERMRRVLSTAQDDSPLDIRWSRPWFDACSERLDAMRTVEALQANELLTLCEGRQTAAAQELAALERLDRTLTQTPCFTSSAAFLEAPDTPLAQAPSQPLGSQLDRAMLELLQAQAQRLQTVSAELETVRASLNERKLIERAKGLLMAHRQLSEDDAHRALRRMAMGQGRRLVDVAETVLAMADVLPVRTG